MATYKLYLTVELPGDYESKDAAMDAAVEALGDACEKYVAEPLLLLKPIDCRVFEDGTILHSGKPVFTIDICDGAI